MRDPYNPAARTAGVLQGFAAQAFPVRGWGSPNIYCVRSIRP